MGPGWATWLPSGHVGPSCGHLGGCCGHVGAMLAQNRGVFWQRSHKTP